MWTDHFCPRSPGTFLRAKVLNLKKEAPAFGILDFSLNATSYIVISKGSLLFERSIPIGIKAIIEGADTPAKLQDESSRNQWKFLFRKTARRADFLCGDQRRSGKKYFTGFKRKFTIEFQVNVFSNFIKGSGDARKNGELQFGDDSFLKVVAPASTVTPPGQFDAGRDLKKDGDLQSKKQQIRSNAHTIMVLIGARS